MLLNIVYFVGITYGLASLYVLNHVTDKILFFNLFYMLPKKLKLKLLNTNFLRKQIKEHHRIFRSTKKSDEFKLFYFNVNTCDLFDDYSIKEIINNIKNKELLNNYDLIKKITIKDGEFKHYAYSKEILSLVTDQNILKEIILFLKEQWDKASIIEMLKNDGDKLLFIKNEDVPSYSCEIIKTMNDDKNKVEAIKYIHLCYKYEIVKTFDDSLKLTFIKDPEFKIYKADLIATLKDKKLILELLIQEKDFEKIISIAKLLKFNNTKEIEEFLKLFPNLTKEEAILFLSVILKNNDNIDPNILKKCNINILKVHKSNINPQQELKKIKSWIYNINVDPNITIGVELETNCRDYKLYINMGNILNNWNFKTEISVDQGIEITSPILHYNNDDMQELFYVTNFLNKNRFFTEKSCGGHIHIGFDYIKDKESLIMLYKLFSYIEPIIFSICNRSETKMRPGVEKYSPPITNLYRNNKDKFEIASDLKNLVQIIKKIQDKRYSSINIKNAFSPNKNTIEFRFPNGEIKYNELLLNIILLAKIVEKSVELSHTTNNDLLNNLSELEKDIPDEDKLNILLDLLFEDNKIKSKYRKRFLYNKEIVEETKKLIYKKEDIHK